jgi:hypothetical protein
VKNDDAPRQDDAAMAEDDADRANAEEQPDWEGIADLLERASSGKLSKQDALAELHRYVPEKQTDVYDRVADQLAG